MDHGRFAIYNSPTEAMAVVHRLARCWSCLCSGVPQHPHDWDRRASRRNRLYRAPRSPAILDQRHDRHHCRVGFTPPLRCVSQPWGTRHRLCADPWRRKLQPGVEPVDLAWRRCLSRCSRDRYLYRHATPKPTRLKKQDLHCVPPWSAESFVYPTTPNDLASARSVLWPG